MLYSPVGCSRSDATNYLGGIADALEDETWRGPPKLPGELGSLCLYRNDRQIKQVPRGICAGSREFLRLKCIGTRGPGTVSAAYAP
jgi:hypothetical protein